MSSRNYRSRQVAKSLPTRHCDTALSGSAAPDPARFSKSFFQKKRGCFPAFPNCHTTGKTQPTIQPDQVPQRSPHPSPPPQPHLPSESPPLADVPPTASASASRPAAAPPRTRPRQPAPPRPRVRPHVRPRVLPRGVTRTPLAATLLRGSLSLKLRQSEHNHHGGGGDRAQAWLTS